MLNIAALRQQQIPLAAEPRSPVPFHILMLSLIHISEPTRRS